MQTHHTLFLVIALGFVGLLMVLFFVMRGRKGRVEADGANQQIYIGNLSYRVSERDLKQHFSRYGRITEVRIVKDRRTGRSKGYAFLTFSSAKEAKKSLVDHGKELGGRSLVVHIAKPR